MKDDTGRRALLLRLALALLACGGALFFSPGLVRDSLAQEQEEIACTATCRKGSCAGRGDSCICSCSWFGYASCICSNQEQAPTSPSA